MWCANILLVIGTKLQEECSCFFVYYAYLSIEELEFVPDQLSLSIGPRHQQVDDGILVSSCVCVCMCVCVCVCMCVCVCVREYVQKA